MAAEVQDKIDRSITKLLKGLETLGDIEAVRDEPSAKRLDRMIESCRIVMADIRKSVKNLTS